MIDGHADPTQEQDCDKQCQSGARCRAVIDVGRRIREWRGVDDVDVDVDANWGVGSASDLVRAVLAAGLKLSYSSCPIAPCQTVLYCTVVY